MKVSGMDINEGLKLIREVEVGKGTVYERCLCHKLVALDECRKVYSGVRTYVEILCPDCRKNMEEQARIVCLGCNRLTSFLPPQRHKCGFVFRSRQHYHIRECCFCEPKKLDGGQMAAKACPVLELEKYAKAQGFVTRVDQDIIRQAEQNSLPEDAGFETLAKRFNRPTK